MQDWLHWIGKYPLNCELNCKLNCELYLLVNHFWSCVGNHCLSPWTLLYTYIYIHEDIWLQYTNQSQLQFIWSSHWLFPSQASLHCLHPLFVSLLLLDHCWSFHNCLPLFIGCCWWQSLSARHYMFCLLPTLLAPWLRVQCWCSLGLHAISTISTCSLASRVSRTYLTLRHYGTKRAKRKQHGQ